MDATLETDSYLESTPHPALERANRAVLAVEQAADVLSETEHYRAVLVEFKRAREAARLAAHIVGIDPDDPRSGLVADACEKIAATVRSFEAARFAGIVEPGDANGNVIDARGDIDLCGSYSSYIKRGCRCDRCKGAAREYKRAQRAKRAEG